MNDKLSEDEILAEIRAYEALEEKQKVIEAEMERIKELLKKNIEVRFDYDDKFVKHIKGSQRRFQPSLFKEAHPDEYDNYCEDVYSDYIRFYKKSQKVDK